MELAEEVIPNSNKDQTKESLATKKKDIDKTKHEGYILMHQHFFVRYTMWSVLTQYLKCINLLQMCEQSQRRGCFAC